MTPAKAKARRKVYKRAHNILHNNVPKEMRHHFIPLTMQAARKTTSTFIPFAAHMQNRIKEIKRQRDVAARKQTPWFKRAGERVKGLFSGERGNPRLERRLNHSS